MQIEKLLLLIPLLYVILQWSALTRMKDGWKWAAAVPAIAMGAALTVFVIGIATNAGMAAMWLVLGLPVATFYLLLLFPIHWLTARQD